MNGKIIKTAVITIMLLSCKVFTAGRVASSTLNLAGEVVRANINSYANSACSVYETVSTVFSLLPGSDSERQSRLGAYVCQQLTNFSNTHHTSMEYLDSIYTSITFRGGNLDITCTRPVIKIGDKVSIGLPSGLSDTELFREINVRYNSLITLYCQQNSVPLPSIRKYTVNLSELYEVDDISSHMSIALGIFPNMEELTFVTNYTWDDQSKQEAQRVLRSQQDYFKKSAQNLQNVALMAKDKIVYKISYNSCWYRFTSFVRSWCYQKEHQN
ncbi:MAG: hypothetical protein NT128_03860 [Proteobacteria bacterium]|nr:hypothetical protein [Pseudomonadota bacterium]